MSLAISDMNIFDIQRLYPITKLDVVQETRRGLAQAMTMRTILDRRKLDGKDHPGGTRYGETQGRFRPTNTHKLVSLVCERQDFPSNPSEEIVSWRY